MRLRGMNIRIKRANVTQAGRVFCMAGLVLALLITLNAPARAEYDGECLSQSFSAFLKEFSESVEAQKASTRFPLEKLKMVEANPLPKRVIEFVDEAQISFPVMAGVLGIDIFPARCEENRVMVYARTRAHFETPLYIFEKAATRQDWRLVRIENWAWPASAKSSWLVNIFPSMKACLPTGGFYYDPEKGASVSGDADSLLEAKGYHNPRLEGKQAIYAIDEKFFGFDATEVSIPSSDISLIRITLKASAEDVARTIEDVTGMKVQVLPEDGEAENSAISVSRKDASSIYVNCYIFEE